MVKQLDSEDEWNEIKNSPTPVIIDFTATWCGPCKMIAPFFGELSTKYPSVKFVKVDVDALENVAQECGISAMPTFQVWQNGKKVNEMVGASKDKLEELVASLAF